MLRWPRSVSADFRDALGFLAAERGCRLAGVSDGGMAGSVAFRSPALWVVAEWDRGDPWLEFTPAGATTDRFPGALVAAWLGVPAPGRGGLGEAPPAALGAWLRAHLGALEVRVAAEGPAAVARALAAASRPGPAGLAESPPVA